MITRRNLTLSSLIACALVAVPGALSAQSAVGFVGGVNFASFSGDDAEDLDRRTGIVAGVFGAFPLGNVLTFRPEIVYSQKGVSFEENGVEGGIQLDYIEVPVLLRIGVPGVGLGLHALAGPTFSFEVGCSADAEGDGAEVSIECEELSDSEDRKTFLVGGQVGAGVDLPMSSVILSLDARYTFDLEALSEEAGSDVANRVWSVTASLGFPFGG